jgi:hypothetical protein
MTRFSRSDYEQLLYSLPERYAEITHTTLRLYPNSAKTAFVRGSVYFSHGLELRIFEYLDLSDGEIFEYSYAIYAQGEKIRWYDPQPHPENLALVSTFPHHFHTAPDIKHNRQPAPGINFSAPNLLQLIADCLTLPGGK